MSNSPTSEYFANIITYRIVCAIDARRYLSRREWRGRACWGARRARRPAGTRRPTRTREGVGGGAARGRCSWAAAQPLMAPPCHYPCHTPCHRPCHLLYRSKEQQWWQRWSGAACVCRNGRGQASCSSCGAS